MHIRRVTIHAERFPRSDCYPYRLPVLQQTGSLAFTAPVTFFVGENGCGKSTLLRAMTRRCNIMIWQGERRAQANYNPHAEALHRFLSVQWAGDTVPGSYFASQVFRNFAQIVDEWAATDPDLLSYFGGRSLMKLSHGQSLMAFFRSRFSRRGLYFLDEPETALSPRSQLDLLALLAERGRSGETQFVVATHSPILLACPGAVIYDFDRPPVRPIAYRDTEHYQVYRDFMSDPDAVLRRLGY